MLPALLHWYFKILISASSECGCHATSTCMTLSMHVDVVCELYMHISAVCLLKSVALQFYFTLWLIDGHYVFPLT